MSVNSQRTLGGFGELSYFYSLTVLESCAFSTERSQKEKEASLSSLCALCPPFVLPLGSNLPLCVTRNLQFSEASTDFSYLVCVHSCVSVWL